MSVRKRLIDILSHPTVMKGLLVLMAVVMYWPYHQFIIGLAQGDLGRDLYAYQQTARGAVPYRDFHYAYGPLMPYYYALFFKIFGVRISSVLLGQIVLKVLSAILVYVILHPWIGKGMAALATIWFGAYQPVFFHTFNHDAGIVVLLALTYWVLRYVIDGRWKWVWFSAAGLSTLTLIKINMGLAMFFAVVIVLTFILAGRQRFSLKDGAKIVGILTAGMAVAGCVYGCLLSGLPDYYVKQCVPVTPGYIQTPPDFRMFSLETLTVFGRLWRESVLGSGLKNLGRMQLFQLWAAQVFFLFLLSGIVRMVFLILARKDPQDRIKNMFPALAVATVFMVFSSHEFIASRLYNYQLNWAAPFLLLAAFLIGGTVLPARGYQRLLWGALFLALACTKIMWRYEREHLFARQPQQWLAEHSGRICLGNNPEWIRTVSRAAGYLRSTIPPGETFFALPYDPLYYYLTDHPSPVPELLFFHFVNIPREQELRIISDLEKKHVNYILLSNRQSSTEKSLGIFGITCCPLLAEYLHVYFKPVATYGRWDQEAGWDDGHAVRIYQRVSASAP